MTHALNFTPTYTLEKAKAGFQVIIITIILIIVH